MRQLAADNVRLATRVAELEAIIEQMRSAVGLTIAKLQQLMKGTEK